MSTTIFKTTMLPEETAVPAVNVPVTKAPVHGEVPVPPLKLYAAVPLVPPLFAATVTEKVQPLATGVKLYIPAIAGVPLAVSIIFCNPVLVKTPEALNDIPLIVSVEIVYEPAESTMTLRVTVLDAVTGVPAVKVPERLAPVQDAVPPLKEYWAVPPPAPSFSKLNSFPQDTKKKDSNNANETDNKKVFFKIKYLRIISLAGDKDI